jgi:adenosine kinase
MEAQEEHANGAAGRLDMVTAGYASLDRIYQVAELPSPGTTGIVLSDDDGRYWGGCAFNIAVGVARMGLRTGVIGTLGDDDGGRSYLSWLSTNGVDTSAVTRSEEARSAASCLFYDPAGTSVCFYRPGASATLGDAGAQMDVLSRAAWLVLSVAPAQLTARLLEKAARRGVSVVWSAKADSQAYPPTLIESLLAGSRIVFLNRAELQFVGDATGLAGARAVLDAGPEMVVLTLGSAGSRVYTREGMIDVPCAPVARVVDATGSGDAYVAGFLAAHLLGKGVSEAALAGAANAASVLEKVGSQTGLCTWEEQLWRRSRS